MSTGWDEQEQVATPVFQDTTRMCSEKPGELVFVYKTPANVKANAAVEVLIKEESNSKFEVSDEGYQELV